MKFSPFGRLLIKKQDVNRVMKFSPLCVISDEILPLRGDEILPQPVVLSCTRYPVVSLPIAVKISFVNVAKCRGFEVPA